MKKKFRQKKNFKRKIKIEKNIKFLLFLLFQIIKNAPKEAKAF